MEEHIISRVQVHIVDSLLAAFNSLGEGNLGRESFELFGYDFMIDEDFRVWLIEVNTNPYLGVQNGWHGKLLEEMSEDLVQLTIDTKFPPPMKQSVKTQESKMADQSESKIEGTEGASVEPRPNGFRLLHSLKAGDGLKTPLPGPRDESWYYPVGKSMTVDVPSTSKLAALHPSPRSPISPRAMKNKYEFNKNPAERIKVPIVFCIFLPFSHSLL